MKEKDYLDHFGNSDLKRSTVYTNMTIYCKNCGHSLLILNCDRLICSHCGYWVYKDDKTEFKYKMLENIKKGK